MKKIIIVALIFLAFVDVVISDNETKEHNQTQEYFHDLKLEAIIDEKVNVDNSYNNLFRITNLNHTRGKTEQIFVSVYYNITKNGSLAKEDIFDIVVNSHTSARTGDYFFDKIGDYVICGRIINSSVNESNFENNHECKNFTVISTLDIPCNVSLTIEIPKFIYQSGEKIEFRHRLSNTLYNYEIEYWVEDLFGNIFRNPHKTTNLNKKSYTPRIETKVEVLKLIANITYIACNDSNKNDNYYEKLVIIKGEEKPKDVCPECSCEDQKKPVSRKAEMEFIDLPRNINVGESFSIKVLIENNNNNRHEFEIWSYIYRGNRCYSESREHNKRAIKIDAHESMIVELKDIVVEAKDGDYNIKVKLKQDNLKTEKEIREEITINNRKELFQEEEKQENIQLLEQLDSEININQIEIEEYKEEITEFNYDVFDYESSSEKSKKLIKYFILTSLTLIVLVVVFKNERTGNKREN